MSDIRCEICETTVYNCTCENKPCASCGGDRKASNGVACSETPLCLKCCQAANKTYHCVGCGKHARWREFRACTDQITDLICSSHQRCPDCCCEENPCDIGECDHELHCISCGSPAEDWSEQNNATDDTLCNDEEFCIDCCNCPAGCKDDAHSWDWDDSEIESASESGVELLVECSLCDCHAHFEYSTTYSNVCEN